jgi:protein arginine kinase activator
MSENDCTNCQKARATIHVLDLQEGVVAAEQHLCAACAENAGVVHSAQGPLKPLKIAAELLSPEMLEEVIGGMTGRTTRESCPACGMSSAQFLSRGRLGCPRCYEFFRKSLIPLLERVHDATSHRGRHPGRPTPSAETSDRLTDLRNSLRDAIDAENYELAANLRDQIRGLSPGEEADA